MQSRKAGQDRRGLQGIFELMSPARRPHSTAKRAMLAGAALAMLFSAGQASAQAEAQGASAAPPAQGRPKLQGYGGHSSKPPKSPAAAQPAHPGGPGPDGLAPGEVYLEADQLLRDENSHRTTAVGNVEIRYENRTLRADRVVYDEGVNGQPGVIHAFGHVQIINADGTAEFAQQYTVDDKSIAGVAVGFSARLQQNMKLASATAVRRSDEIQELNDAIYTPCPICTANGQPKHPAWSISASRIVQDKRHRLIFYKHARIRIFGVPVLYFPVFWNADPSAKRSSGFLAPRFGDSERRGFSYEQPYLFVLSPSTELVLSPQINSKVNPFLNGALYKRFYSGEMDLRFGYTHDYDFSGDGQKFGTSTNRSYILGHGDFTLNDKWTWGFTAERTSDKLLFDKYDIGQVFVSRGPYVADDRRLISQIYTIRQDTNAYFSAAAMSIEGLRPDLNNPTVIENSRVFPVIGPLIENDWEPNTTIAGGRLRTQLSAVALTRDQSADTTLATPATGSFPPGLDSRRITAEADWRRSFTLPIGLRVDPFLQVRADGYSLGDILLQPVTVAGGGFTTVGTQTTSNTQGRVMGTLGADITYPFYRRWRDATVVLEPIVQLAYSPNVKEILVGRTTTGAPIYLNEDSVAFELDETTLFRANKFPGYDLYQQGARANVGGRASVIWDDDRRASLLIGRSFSDQTQNLFNPGSGLQGRSSDWVVYGEAQPIKGLSFFGRTLLDGDTFKVHRVETGLNVQSKFLSGFVRYFSDNTGQFTNPAASAFVTPAVGSSSQSTRNIDVGGQLPITKNWGLTAYGSRDLLQQAWVIRDVGVYYQDDCLRVDVIYQRQDTVIGRLGPSDRFMVRLTLATLGGAINIR